MKFHTPILFLGFNRPDCAKELIKVFEILKPSVLYVAVDGPRTSVEGEKEKCDETAQLFDNLSWPCEVHKLIRDRNLGCALAVSGAITWFFENEEQGIILEDDCIPSLSFFSFCEEMLGRYKNNNQIFHIGGTNYQNGKIRGDGDYYFSVIPHVWGWASWRRAWRHFNLEFTGEIIAPMNSFVSYSPLVKYCERGFQNAVLGRIDSWAYRWTYWCWYYQGISILPNVNMVSNIGFGNNSTHTKSNNSPLSRMVTKELEFPLKHPSSIKIHSRADRYTYEKVYKGRMNTWVWFKSSIKRVLIKVLKVLKLDNVFLPKLKNLKMKLKN